MLTGSVLDVADPVAAYRARCEKMSVARALASTELLGRRASVRHTNRYLARVCAAYKCGHGRVQDEDLWGQVASALTRAMCEAHASARRLLRAHKLQREPVLARVELSLREARSLVRALPEEERAHVNEVYGLIARDVTNKTRARVRDRLLSDVNDLLRRRPKTWRRDARESLKRLGVSKDAGHLVDTAVRTHSSIAFNAAVWVEAQDPELWGFEYSTAGDERVRPSHRAFESGGVGVRYPKDHAFWRQFAPPNGWNCRCTLNPIYVGDPDAITVPFTGVPDVPTAFRFNPGKIFLGA